MWQNKRATAQPQPAQNTRSTYYPSKLISELMDSDSDNEQASNGSSQHEQYEQPHQNLGGKPTRTPSSTSTLVPALIKVTEREKQNISIQSNRNAKQIRYSYYRLQGQKLIESTGQYNSLNLEDASIIKDSNQILANEVERMKEERKEMDRRVCQLLNENRVLKRQLCNTKEQLETKDNIYEQIEQQLKKKTKEQEKLNKKITQLEKELQQKRQDICRLENQKKRNIRKDTELSQFIEGLNSNVNMNKQNYDTGTNRKNGNDSVEKIYGDVTVYIVKRVEELRDRLLGQKMSKNVEDIIEEFMAQLININPITVSRVIPKTRQTCTPVRKLKTQIEPDNSILIRNSIFQQQQQSAITPTKPEPRQKPQQLRNLQKSLQKLRDMEKSYISSTPNNPNSSHILNGGKDSYNSLDRSSVMGVDRSKSRRKKIFQ